MRAPIRVLGVTGMNKLMTATMAIAKGLSTEVVADIGTSLVDPPYPYFLEYGTVKMSARPSARPAFFVAQHEAEQAGTAALRALFAAGMYSQPALHAAARAMSLPIQSAWKRYTPVKTGTYRRSIHAEVHNA